MEGGRGVPSPAPFAPGARAGSPASGTDSSSSRRGGAVAFALVDLPFERLDPGAELPSHARPGDAGLDLRSAIDVEVAPGERAMVPTGLAVAIPEGHCGLVLPRSGLASREGLTLANSPGLIDAGYRGEVTCAVVNLDRERPVRIARGDRIAQLLIVAVPAVRPVVVDELPPSERGSGGFGSTGR
ncbi:MAG: dUTP diphosphatase [Actinobacteria bacterium]|nr:dUTP diphosphatase [Actinomycetota bacterium]